MTDDVDPLLTVSEIARRWRVSRTTVLRRIRDGTLPAITLNKGPVQRRHVRVRLSDLERYERQEQ